MRYLALFLTLIFFVSTLHAKPAQRIIDLTYAFDSDSVYWPTAETFK